MIKYNENSSVIRQKGECQNEGSEKAKHAKFSKKRTFQNAESYKQIWKNKNG